MAPHGPPSRANGVPAPLTIAPPGPREVVDEDKAHALVAQWTTLLADHEIAVRLALGIGETDPLPPGTVLCDAINLSDKSYTAAAAVVIASFLTRGERSIASDITIADLSDIIRCRPCDEDLQVMQTLCDAFRSAKLVEVNLSDNCIGKGISACQTVLAGMAGSLERLSLCNIGLCEASMAEVAGFLTSGHGDGSDSGCAAENLTKIHFDYNMVGIGGCHAFAQILSRCTTRLVDVGFSGTRHPGREGSLVVASAFDTMGDNVQNLERLDLADNTFGVEGGRHLANVFGRCPRLTYLNLHDCMCEDTGIGLICHAIWSADAPLVEFNVSGNELTRGGARAIVEMLEENTTLTKFSAEDNELTSLGVKAIVGALANGEGECIVESINLNQNEIGRIGCAAILEAYGEGAGMPRLTKISLDNNCFSEEDVEALKAAFGDKLVPIEENDDEEDIDDQLSYEEVSKLFDMDALHGELAKLWETKIEASKGDAEAMFILGTWHHSGMFGIEHSEQLAYAWYCKAAVLLHPAAMYRKGMCLINGHAAMEKNLAAGIGLISAAAHMGSEDAAVHLVFWYSEGQFGLERNPALARYYLEKVGGLTFVRGFDAIWPGDLQNKGMEHLRVLKIS